MSGPRRRLVLGAIALVHLVLGALLFEPILFSGGDNVRYMVVGEALRSGLGYLDIHLPDTPLHTKYPPLYPALLAVLGFVGELQLFKVASLALTTGSVVLTGWLGARLFRPAIGYAAAAVMAVNPVLLQYSHWVLSEAPFVFLVTATLVAWEAWEDRRPDGADAPDGGDGGAGEGGAVPWLALGLAAAAFMTRTAGIALLVVAVALPALRRRWRPALAAAAVVLVTAGGWALYQSLAAPDRAGYLAELLMVDPYQPAEGRVGPAGLLRRAAENAWLYVGSVLPSSFTTEPVVGRPSGGLAEAVFGAAVFAAAVAGWVRRSLSRLGPTELFALVYAGIVVLWPSVWTDQRFLLPVLPLVAIYGLAGAGRALERVSGHVSTAGAEGRVRRTVVGVLAAGTVALGVLDAVRHVPSRIDCFAGWQRGAPCIHPGYRAFFDVARWTRENTPADAIVANRKPAFFWWFGRRRGDVYPFTDDRDAVLEGLDEMGATHVVLDGTFGTTVQYLRPAVLEHRDRFVLLHRTGPPDTYLLGYMPAPRTASGPGDPKARSPGPGRQRGDGVVEAHDAEPGVRGEGDELLDQGQLPDAGEAGVAVDDGEAARRPESVPEVLADGSIVESAGPQVLQVRHAAGFPADVGANGEQAAAPRGTGHGRVSGTVRVGHVPEAEVLEDGGQGLGRAPAGGGESGGLVPGRGDQLVERVGHLRSQARPGPVRSAGLPRSVVRPAVQAELVLAGEDRLEDVGRAAADTGVEERGDQRVPRAQLDAGGELRGRVRIPSARVDQPPGQLRGGHGTPHVHEEGEARPQSGRQLEQVRDAPPDAPVGVHVEPEAEVALHFLHEVSGHRIRGRGTRLREDRDCRMLRSNVEAASRAPGREGSR